MMATWYDRDPTLLDGQKQEVQSEYPTLHFYRERDRLFVRGSLPLVHDDRVLDRFSIEIELPRNRPDDIPIIRETGGRIPRVTDNHINVAHGDICLFVPEERWRVFPTGSSLLDFLKGPVRNYFLGYSLKQLGEPWPFGERPHGKDGIIQYYSELLGTSDEKIIRRYVQCLSKKSFKRHWPCPCGSGKKIRNCHGSQIQELREKIPWAYAMKSLRYL
ncbi:MAG TPA: hypothetical protein VGO56_14130 [Pyrinomonadaceae bacterium]|jgi:hypothetical protein|nr:hypothetical protein [Pyrinomonadaceae bacterium]